MARPERPRRVFLGLTNVSGYFSQLRAGFEQLGIRSTLATDTEHRFGYAGEEKAHPLVRLLRFLLRQRANTALPLWLRRLLRIPLIASRLLLLIWAVARHDVFVFAHNSTFFGFRELPLLKRAGRKIIYLFLGSDSRPVYLDGAFVADSDLTPRQVVDMTARQKRTVDTIERWADVVISYPVHAHFHRKPIVFTTLVGFPFDFDASPRPRNGDEVVIVHAPSARASKGSAEIRRAVAALVAKGHPIRFVEISGKPHHEVLEAIAACDIVIDQLYSDAPVSAIAAEAACLGKPTVIGGYAWSDIQRAYPEGTVPPVVYCRPEELEATVESLVVDADKRRRVGEEARRYYEKNWGPRNVAERFVRMIRGDIPPEWVADPSQVRYTLGYGLTPEAARRWVRAVIETGGREALCVSDKPALEQRLVDFAAGAA